MIKSDSDEQEHDLDIEMFSDNKLAADFISTNRLRASKEKDEIRAKFRDRIREIFESKVEAMKQKPSFRRILLGVMSKHQTRLINKSRSQLRRNLSTLSERRKPAVP